MINQETVVKELLELISKPLSVENHVRDNVTYPIGNGRSATLSYNVVMEGEKPLPSITICDVSRGIATISYDAGRSEYVVKYIATPAGGMDVTFFPALGSVSDAILNYISGEVSVVEEDKDLGSFKSMISCLDIADRMNAENIPRIEVELTDGNTLHLTNQYRRSGPVSNILLSYLVKGKATGAVSRRATANAYRATHFGEDSSVCDFTVNEFEEMFKFITKGPASEEMVNDLSDELVEEAIESPVEELLAKEFNVDGKATYTLKMIIREVAGSISEFDQKNIPVFGSLINIRNLASGIDPDVPTHLVETYRGGMDEFQFKMVKIKDKSNTVVATITPVPGDSIRVRTPYYDGTFKLSGFYAVSSKTISTIIFGK